MKVVLFVLAALSFGADAFTAPKPSLQLQKPSPVALSMNHEPKKMDDESISNLVGNLVPKAALATTAMWTTATGMASAAGPDWGIFEGRTGSLLHPVVMGGMFLFYAYTAFLGFQWRRQRTLGDEISQLKKSLPDMGGASSVADAIAAAEEAQDTAKVATLNAAKETEGEIAALQQERKDLASAGPRDKHFAQGALLAFIGTAFAIEGPLNTYARTGKLFPGPHLFVGASLVVLWSLAVGTIPAMQKGNDTARTIHISANCLGLSFFAWQIQSGIPILLKTIEKTSWP